MKETETHLKRSYTRASKAFTVSSLFFTQHDLTNSLFSFEQKLWLFTLMRLFIIFIILFYFLQMRQFGGRVRRGSRESSIRHWKGNGYKYVNVGSIVPFMSEIWKKKLLLIWYLCGIIYCFVRLMLRIQIWKELLHV